jgi:hypothetical protein
MWLHWWLAEECTNRRTFKSIGSEKSKLLEREPKKRKEKKKLRFMGQVLWLHGTGPRGEDVRVSRRRVLEAQSPVVGTAVMHPAKPLFVLCLMVKCRRKLLGDQAKMDKCSVDKTGMPT